MCDSNSFIVALKNKKYYLINVTDISAYEHKNDLNIDTEKVLQQLLNFSIDKE